VAEARIDFEIDGMRERTWRGDALRRIAQVHAAMPDADAAALRKELRKHASEFHCGTSWGRKVWPKACAEYLKVKFGIRPPQKRVEDSPLFKPADHAFPFRNQ